MGQAEVQKVLMKNRKKWLTSEEIKKEIPEGNVNRVRRSLLQMFKYSEIRRKVVGKSMNGGSIYVYQLALNY